MRGASKKKLYTVLVMAIGVGLFLTLVFGRTQPEKRQPPAPPAPLVDVVVVHPVSHQLLVRTQGNIEPRREIDLVAQVTGKIVSASNHFADGSFFRDGERLIGIEQDDYLIGEQQAKAKVADAEQLLAAEKGRARQSKREWRDLGNTEANELFLRKPQLASAEAALLSAKAGLEKARLDIKRTQIAAPFSGRIRQTLVDVGQYVTVGTKIARIYSTDIAEVRLPLTDRQAAMLDLPQHYQDTDTDRQSTPSGLPVRLQSHFGSNSSSWQAYIVRTDASIDIESRQLFAVAEISNPFARDNKTPRQAALNIGQFVDAYIKGKVVDNVLILPRKTLRPQNRIWVVGPDNRLRIVKVEVLQTHQDQIVVRDNFTGPQQVVLSKMALAVEGMALAPKQVDSDPNLELSKASTPEATP
jgi:RND family efflux transporter MFP subunit